MIIFLLAFGQVFLVAMNTRNLAQSRYLGAGCTSLGLGTMWVFSLKILSENHFTTSLIFAHVIGGALGAMSGAYFHKHYSKPKAPERW